MQTKNINKVGQLQRIKEITKCKKKFSFTDTDKGFHKSALNWTVWFAAGEYHLFEMSVFEPGKRYACPSYIFSVLLK